MDTKKRRTGWPVWLGSAFAALLLYILSVGPAFWILDRGCIDAEDFNDRILPLYWPLFFVAERFRPLMTFLNWYMNG